MWTGDRGQGCNPTKCAAYHIIKKTMVSTYFSCSGFVLIEFLLDGAKI
jgi:hypothetical protein